MKVLGAVLFVIVAAGETLHAQQSESLDKLAGDFWTWRARYAPFNGDDVPRMERPGGMRDWSRAKIDNHRSELAEFESRWKKIDINGWPVPKQVDYSLIGSALSRVRWELDINPRWKRDPNFYIEQTLTALVEALTVPAPYDESRSREILTRIENIPSILRQGAENLDNPPAPFATVSVQNLDGIRERLRKMATALVRSTTLKQQELNGAIERAADALEKFRGQLQEKLPTLSQQTALALERELHSLRTGAFGESRLLLARDRDGSAAHLRARRNSRSLFPALSLLETRRPNSPALLRLGRERRDRILRRGNDVAGRFVRRQPTHARDHLQFHAFARTPRGSGREACTRPFQPRTSRKIFT